MLEIMGTLRRIWRAATDISTPNPKNGFIRECPLPSKNFTNMCRTYFCHLRYPLSAAVKQSTAGLTTIRLIHQSCTMPRRENEPYGLPVLQRFLGNEHISTRNMTMFFKVYSWEDLIYKMRKRKVCIPFDPYNVSSWYLEGDDLDVNYVDPRTGVLLLPPRRRGLGGQVAERCESWQKWLGTWDTRRNGEKTIFVPENPYDQNFWVITSITRNGQIFGSYAYLGPYMGSRVASPADWGD